ncbi:MAG: UDP-N-acetylmuramoyl-L-alanyl-D-glutamate--2,6-diaminopimelate ligase [Dissulfurimicrobium sp.]|uniref:UDP-N-acetylmuramoyl-L-alanyl-D-glutamate--2, 6-diaminopimelate ligase n=1 Tax=Dissulfurimicrobium sp. TaxID=2022436 RepID=UPI00404B4EB7
MKIEETDIIKLISDHAVAGITSDSRKVRPGFIFVAIPGINKNGKAFIQDAIKNGAKIVVTQVEDTSGVSALTDTGIRFAFVDDPRASLGRLASAFFEWPAKHMDIIGITGTNGKTTITYILEAIFMESGMKPGVMGTISRRYGGKDIPSELTTPDPVTIQSSLADMLKDGVNVVAMEVSSHALDQKRVEGCVFKAAVFTNLTRDHMDYHHDMDAYFLAKASLFTRYPVDTSVINLDDPYGQRLWSMVKGRKIGYAIDREADIGLKSFKCGLMGTKAHIITPSGGFEVSSRLIGRHNLYNMLAATGAALALGISVEQIRRGIEAVFMIPGRLEPVALHQNDITALVDYAHTPDALENVLKTLASLTKDHTKKNGRIICVTGCGGDRDQGKRPIMARIAAALSDIAIFTSDNPRGEDPETILKEMLQGLQAPTPTPNEKMAQVEVITDRREAIYRAAEIARPGDCLLVAGKGHETYQIKGDKRLPFDDRKVIREAFGMRLSLCQVAAAIGAKVVYGGQGGDGGYSGVSLDKIGVYQLSIDSRNVLKGDIFCAIRGERFDGKDFVRDAIKNGACCAIISQTDDRLFRDIAAKTPILVVPDTLKALGDLAAWYRRHLGLKVAAITGSCGKTTTKEAVASILQKRYRVIKTKGNFNNLVGLPLSLFEARQGDSWAVLEMGMNQPGEIARLAEIAAPDMALITNIRPVHLERLGDLEGVAREKGEIFKALGRDGIAVVNIDDPLVLKASEGIECRKVFYSTKNEARDGIRPDVFLVSWSPLDMATSIEINTGGLLMTLDIPLIGMANIQNAIAAAAVGHAMGLSKDEIIAGLHEMKGVEGRIGIEDLGRGFYLMDDSYNANPASMALAIDTLSIWGKGRKMAILGDMLELGRDARRFHGEIGAATGQAGLDMVISVGEFSDIVADEAKRAGTDSIAFRDTDTLAVWLKANATKIFSGPCTVLVKGSRGMKCDKVSNILRELFMYKGETSQ